MTEAGRKYPYVVPLTNIVQKRVVLIKGCKIGANSGFTMLHVVTHVRACTLSSCSLNELGLADWKGLPIWKPLNISPMVRLMHCDAMQYMEENNFYILPLRIYLQKEDEVTIGGRICYRYYIVLYNGMTEYVTVMHPIG